MPYFPNVHVYTAEGSGKAHGQDEHEGQDYLCILHAWLHVDHWIFILFAGQMGSQRSVAQYIAM